MRRTKAFTLIELLVVIAIIALLMAVLMPALARVRKHARTVACQSNLHEWALIFAMYTGDNNGYLMTGYASQGAATSRDTWIGALRSHYQDPKIRVCPTAVKPFSEGGQGPFSAWGVFGRSGETRTWAGPRDEGDYGSYGMNELAYNPPSEVTSRAAEYWRTVNVPHAAEVPLFFDCIWFDVFPRDTDAPPAYDGDVTTGEMKRVCINRHDGYANDLFMDSSLRKIALKGLWALRWYRGFNLANVWTKAGGVTPADWPAWMKAFKDD
ncbi:MAG: type II secretion system GspH family protein [Planctomycetes bacterium]|jgi:prepilin-type N-terminal cleavage/methylation domain-containing protein|nr:type II secretion system GspH family protein [Planctomycetota bacterium]